MKAMPHLRSWRSPREIEAVEALLRRALEVSPDYPRAHSLLAWARATAVHQGWANMREGLSDVGALAQRALQLDSRDPWSHFVAGYVRMMSRDFSRALEDYTKAIELKASLSPT
jgi:adenylate cyclase